jgi:hypothetical protein
MMQPQPHAQPLYHQPYQQPYHQQQPQLVWQAPQQLQAAPVSAEPTVYAARSRAAATAAQPPVQQHKVPCNGGVLVAVNGNKYRCRYYKQGAGGAAATGGGGVAPAVVA